MNILMRLAMPVIAVAAVAMAGPLRAADKAGTEANRGLPVVQAAPTAHATPPVQSPPAAPAAAQSEAAVAPTAATLMRPARRCEAPGCVSMPIMVGIRY